MATAPVIKQCNELSLQMMKQVSFEVVYMVQAMDQRSQLRNINAFSPLELHAVYRAAVVLAWMGLHSGQEDYGAGKAACMRWMEYVDGRWGTAGKLFSFMDSTINDEDE
jgi:hypothetical protein